VYPVLVVLGVVVVVLVVVVEGWLHVFEAVVVGLAVVGEVGEDWGILVEVFDFW
jgi:hypothetical protein